MIRARVFTFCPDVQNNNSAINFQLVASNNNEVAIFVLGQIFVFRPYPLLCLYLLILYVEFSATRCAAGTIQWMDRSSPKTEAVNAIN